MMEDDGAGSGQQEMANGNRMDKGQQITTDQQSTSDGSGKGKGGYSCEGKGCMGGEWDILLPRGPWQRQKSWRQWQGSGRQKTTVAAAFKQQSTKSDDDKWWH
jgi:hypothetical protein